ncbi:T9SS type A sorting domain-containing protein [Psychroserpens sp.]
MTGAKIASGNESEIATSSFSKGIYILKLDFYEGTVVKRIVIN